MSQGVWRIYGEGDIMENCNVTRTTAIGTIMQDVTNALAGGVTVEGLEQAKASLVNLAGDAVLFPTTVFPMPEGDATDRTYLVYENEDGMALYAITSIPGMTYRPHDHGGSWAIIAAVAGQEKHCFYEVAPGDENKGVGEPVRIQEKTQIICEDDCAVSMMPEGIHSIEGIGDKPLLHLHLYGTRFQDQSARTEYNMETGMAERFVMDAFGFIEDKR